MKTAIEIAMEKTALKKMVVEGVIEEILGFMSYSGCVGWMLTNVIVRTESGETVNLDYSRYDICLREGMRIRHTRTEFCGEWDTKWEIIS